ncbi:TIGR01244 family sulfur transferase [Bartonella tamiae]|uniref:TIGR01244 family protein n=1 Tax=Bartonella tamiae Th239 TaxID=1094558 RepID=J0R3Y0_9HYPH|nr:TIGR01244 family sulfur transferase [Bartonella tamiae]EJF90349.1 TIGR01244 family protein [Bartonella tamiae Th239]EJF93710.1 TIGR01244 family protein [Bartonella tamiae Th307]
MTIREIDEDVFVSGQITEEFVDELAQAGFKTIICNRPDKEETTQIDFARIKEKAEKCGMDVYYIPVSPPQLEQATIDHMQTTLQSAKKPILAYCRSGSRSSQLYQLIKNQTTIDKPHCP